jgi:hypothetical protein
VRLRALFEVVRVRGVAGIVVIQIHSLIKRPFDETTNTYTKMLHYPNNFGILRKFLFQILINSKKVFIFETPAVGWKCHVQTYIKCNGRFFEAIVPLVFK